VAIVGVAVRPVTRGERLTKLITRYIPIKTGRFGNLCLLIVRHNELIRPTRHTAAVEFTFKARLLVYCSHESRVLLLHCAQNQRTRNMHSFPYYKAKVSGAMSGRTYPSCVMLTSETTLGLHACNFCNLWWNERFTRKLIFIWEKPATKNKQTTHRPGYTALSDTRLRRCHYIFLLFL